MNQYYLGQSAALAVAFSTGAAPTGREVVVAATGQTIKYNGNLSDPTTVTLKIQDGSGASTTNTFGVGGVIQRDSAGVYYALISVGVVGSWTYEWAGDAGTTSAKLDFGTFAVVADPI